MCQPLTRRQLLRHGALVAATFPMIDVVRPGWSLASAAAQGVAVPMHLEVVTVSDTRAVVTWFTGDPSAPDEFGRPAPVAAPGRLLLGSSPDPSSWEEVARHGPTPYHHAEVGGLEPGVRYYFRAESGGIPAVPTAFSPLHPDPSNAGTFTTLVPPPGRELLTVAWLNDLHIGEHTSGLAYSDPRLPGGGFPPGYAVDPENPYWRTMARACVADASARGARLMLCNGDLTSEAEPAELAEAREHLDSFGRLGGGLVEPGEVRHVGADGPRAYYVTRGNHDRAHSGPMYRACPPVGDSDLRDCFLSTFDGGFDGASARFTVTAGDDRARYRFVGLDSCDLASGSGQMTDDELEHLEAQLAVGDATIPLFHHTVGDQSTTFAVPPIVFGVEPAQGRRLRELLGRADNVAGVYNGHTHRNLRSTSFETGSVPYFEGGAAKEYPGGFTTVRLFEGGYMVNFWKASDPEALAWSERSRGEYLGLYPYYTLGGLGDRNWTYDVDARVRRGSGDPSPSPSPSGTSPTGSPTATPAGGSPSPSPTSGPTSGPTTGPTGGSTDGGDGDLPTTGGGAVAVGAVAAVTAAAALRRRGDT